MNDDGVVVRVRRPVVLGRAGGLGERDRPARREAERDRPRRATSASRSELAHKPPAAGLAFTHARVLDVEHGRWLADQTVVVVGDTIKAVGPSATHEGRPRAPRSSISPARRSCPGLWDMHSHLGTADGVLDIASGVTTARDVGNDPDQLDDFKKRFDDGDRHRPARACASASSRAAARRRRRARSPRRPRPRRRPRSSSIAKRGYEGIKIYNSMKPELVPVLAKEAHARGMTVTGHIPVHMLANEAVRAGYDGIEHVNMLFLNFFADHDTDTRTPLRFSLVGDKAADFDLASRSRSQDFFALLAPAPDRHRSDARRVRGPATSASRARSSPGTEWLVARLPVQVQRQLPRRAGCRSRARSELYARVVREAARDGEGAPRRQRSPSSSGTDDARRPDAPPRARALRARRASRRPTRSRDATHRRRRAR